MSKNKKYIINRAKCFYELQSFFKMLLSDKIYGDFKILKKAEMYGILNLNEPIADSINKYINNVSVMEKATEAFTYALYSYNEIVLSLDQENVVNFCQKKLIDVILEKTLLPYQESAITNIYFASNDKDKTTFLENQINNVLSGGTDFRIITYLPDSKIDKETLQDNSLYNELIKYLIDFYMVGYNKDNKDETKALAIRILYRHLNREYFIPDLDMKKKIIYSYVFNEWFMNLDAIVRKNMLKITNSEKSIIIDEVLKALNDRVEIGHFFKGEVVDLYDKINNIIDVINKIDVDTLKLERKGE